jgi:hypothetical protein
MIIFTNLLLKPLNYAFRGGVRLILEQILNVSEKVKYAYQELPQSENTGSTRSEEDERKRNMCL